jgi:hypothetical protein
MIHQVQRVNYVIISILVTVIIHFMLWELASHMKLHSFDALTYVENKRVTVWSVDLDELSYQDSDPLSKHDERLIKKQKQRVKEILKKAGVPRLSPTRNENLVSELIKKSPPPPRPDRVSELAPISLPSSEVLAIDADLLSCEELEEKRPLIPKKKNVPPPMSVFATRPNSEPVFKQVENKPSLILKVPSMPAGRHLPGRFMSLDKGFHAAPMNILKQDQSASLVLAQRSVLDEEIEILDSVLDVKFKAYHERNSGEIFYEIQITTRETAENIPAIPKDVLFLIDASASISFEKLKEFKMGLKHSLQSLNFGDAYNIVAFRERPIPQYQNFTSLSLKNIADTREFVDELRYSGKTDIYAGLAPYVSITREQPDRPYQIFLISDGRTTSGFRFANNELIRRIGNENSARASIFSFSCGNRTNLFLMDFLSLNNRGVGRHVQRVYNSHRALEDFVNSLSEILVLDLIYNVTNELKDEVYPKELPHLYRSHPLRLYGKIDADISEIAIQVVGRNIRGRKEELVRRLNLADAEPASSDIAYQWALQKIYYLINRSVTNRMHDAEDTIRSLIRKYNISIPYQ